MSPIVLTLDPLKTLLLFQGKELARDGYNHEIISVTEAGSVATSKLVIKKTQEEDFGKYQVREAFKKSVKNFNLQTSPGMKKNLQLKNWLSRIHF